MTLCRAANSYEPEPGRRGPLKLAASFQFASLAQTVHSDTGSRKCSCSRTYDSTASVALPVVPVVPVGTPANQAAAAAGVLAGSGGQVSLRQPRHGVSRDVARGACSLTCLRQGRSLIMRALRPGGGNILFYFQECSFGKNPEKRWTGRNHAAFRHGRLIGLVPTL